MSNILNRFKEYFSSKTGNFFVGVIGIVGAVAGIIGIIPLFIGDSEPVMSEKIVHTILENYQQQLSVKDKQLLLQDELEKQLVEVVQTLLDAQRQGDLEAQDAFGQLRETGNVKKARVYFGKWTKVADNVKASNGARYAGTLDYLDDPKAGMLQFQDALQLDPENPQNPVFQNYIGKVDNKTTGINSPIIDKIEGNVTFGLPVDKEK